TNHLRKASNAAVASISLDNLTDILSSARALKRALIVDAIAKAEVPQNRSEFGLHGEVERLARAHGVHTIVSVRNLSAATVDRGGLAKALLAAANQPVGAIDSIQFATTSELGGALDIAEWFHRVG